jgi:hypothetical protein
MAARHTTDLKSGDFGSVIIAVGVAAVRAVVPSARAFNNGTTPRRGCNDGPLSPSPHIDARRHLLNTETVTATQALPAGLMLKKSGIARRPRVRAAK